MQYSEEHDRLFNVTISYRYLPQHGGNNALSLENPPCTQSEILKAVVHVRVTCYIVTHMFVISIYIIMQGLYEIMQMLLYICSAHIFFNTQSPISSLINTKLCPSSANASTLTKSNSKMLRKQSQKQLVTSIHSKHFLFFYYSVFEISYYKVFCSKTVFRPGLSFCTVDTENTMSQHRAPERNHRTIRADRTMSEGRRNSPSRPGTRGDWLSAPR